MFLKPPSWTLGRGVRVETPKCILAVVRKFAAEEDNSQYMGHKNTSEKACTFMTIENFPQVALMSFLSSALAQPNNSKNFSLLHALLR